MHTTTFYFSPVPLRDHAMVVAIVVALHFVALVAWHIEHTHTAPALHEMEVMIAAAPATAQVETPPQRSPEAAAVKPLPVEQPVPAEAPEIVHEAPVAVAPPQVVAAAPASIVVTEAHFDADYLHNPTPKYPVLSRKLQEQGKVLVQVSVTAAGLAEHVQIKQGSGFPRLDEAALNTVRLWRFVPARRGDEAISSSVVVPIVFRLDS